MSLPIYLMPGVGADERLFAGLPDARVLPRLSPEGSLADYAARLAPHIDASKPFDLGGSSFGGMIALELARQVVPQHVFLFGSCRSPRAIAPSLRMLRFVLPAMHPPRWMRPFVARWFGARTSAEIALFSDMLSATPIEFIRWASRAAFSWSGVPELPMPVHHIHGERDRIIPLRRVNPDRVVRGAGHLINLTHADEVSEFILTSAAASL